MSDWLKRRLTLPKATEPRWQEFAQVFERVWEDYFDPDLSRLERLRSSYTADEADLVKKIREMGDYFSFDKPNRTDFPVSLAWRRLELEYKDMELILSSIFRRHFSNLPVTWFPIFAPKDLPYGMEFMVAEGPWPDRKNAPPEDMFLTSRGRLGTDYGYLLSLGYLKQTFLDKALSLLMRAKPLHIVYDGPLWYIWHDLFFEASNNNELLYWERENDFIELQFSVLGSRFDYTAADDCFLDMQSSLCQWERDNYQSLPFISEKDGTWHLDHYLSENIPEDWLPLDTIIYGNEYAKNPLTTAALSILQTYHINITDFVSDYTHIEEHAPIYAKQSKSEITLNSEIEPTISLQADFKNFEHLDHYPLFDDFPIDTFPLDMPIGGVYV